MRPGGGTCSALIPRCSTGGLGALGLRAYRGYRILGLGFRI